MTFFQDTIFHLCFDRGETNTTKRLKAAICMDTWKAEVWRVCGPGSFNLKGCCFASSYWKQNVGLQTNQGEQSPCSMTVIIPFAPASLSSSPQAVRFPEPSQSYIAITQDQPGSLPRERCEATKRRLIPLPNHTHIEGY